MLAHRQGCVKVHHQVFPAQRDTWGLSANGRQARDAPAFVGIHQGHRGFRKVSSEGAIEVKKVRCGCAALGIVPAWQQMPHPRRAGHGGAFLETAIDHLCRHSRRSQPQHQQKQRRAKQEQFRAAHAGNLPNSRHIKRERAPRSEPFHLNQNNLNQILRCAYRLLTPAPIRRRRGRKCCIAICQKVPMDVNGRDAGSGRIAAQPSHADQSTKPRVHSTPIAPTTAARVGP